MKFFYNFGARLSRILSHYKRIDQDVSDILFNKSNHTYNNIIFELHHVNNGFLPRRKQRCRSALQLLDR